MATVLKPNDYVHLLRCPCPAEGSLTIASGNTEASCDLCGKRFSISKDAILEYVDPTTLDFETARELKGNTYELSDDQIQQTYCKNDGDIWSDSIYYSSSHKRIISCLLRYLGTIDCNTIFILGAGRGRDILYLLQFREYDTIFASDISYTALRIIPFRLKDYQLKVGLFTHNLEDECPIGSRDIPILIHEVLHHTQDMHAAIGKLLSKGYQDIVFVEPTNNFVIEYLEKLNLARRVEYSGVKPGRLELKLLREMCRHYGYKTSISTMWVFPQDYLRRLIKGSGVCERIFTWMIIAISVLTNPLNWGNISMVHLHKNKEYEFHESAAGGGD